MGYFCHSFLKKEEIILLVSYGWSLVERLDGAWKKTGEKRPRAWLENGWCLAKGGTGKSVGIGKRTLFHDMFHEDDTNVSERSLTFPRRTAAPPFSNATQN